MEITSLLILILVWFSFAVLPYFGISSLTLGSSGLPKSRLNYL